MSGAIPPLPNMPSWRRARLKKAQGQLYLYLYMKVTSGVYMHDMENTDMFPERANAVPAQCLNYVTKLLSALLSWI
jgi:hypothetical protein